MFPVLLPVIAPPFSPLAGGFDFSHYEQIADFILFALFIEPLSVGAEAKYQTLRISGTVRDSLTGKPVIAANLLLNYGKGGIITDTAGYFSYKLPAGNHSIILNRLGYRPFRTKLEVNRDTVFEIRIIQVPNDLEEVVITTQAVDQNIIKPILGVSQLSNLSC